MSMPISITRRRALGWAVAAGPAAAFASTLDHGRGLADSQTPPSGASPPAPAREEYVAKPLPFDPSKCRGLSEKLLLSHHQNNYGGAVRRLNAIRRQIAALPRNAAPFQMGSLQREALIAMNSMILHESYFANLGGDGRAEGPALRSIETAFGSFDEWERQFRLTGLALGGGSGWAILAYSPRDGSLHNVWAADHAHGLAGGVPLLAMDMYEHAYAIDFGADAKAYVDAFFQNVLWAEVNRWTESAFARK